jgi:hypothetical protein
VSAYSIYAASRDGQCAMAAAAGGSGAITHADGSTGAKNTAAECSLAATRGAFVAVHLRMLLRHDRRAAGNSISSSSSSSCCCCC